LFLPFAFDYCKAKAKDKKQNKGKNKSKGRLLPLASARRRAEGRAKDNLKKSIIKIEQLSISIHTSDFGIL
jgi:hypothetical protein